MATGDTNVPIQEPLFEDLKSIIKSPVWIMFFRTLAKAVSSSGTSTSSSGDSFLVSQVFN